MSRSYIIGVPGIAHVADHVTGSVRLAPGVPVTATRELQAALLPRRRIHAADIVQSFCPWS